jgi:SAM-dependent methyltransferase
MSHQAALTERAFLAALDLVRPLLGPGARIADLGCFTGATAKWLALNDPTIEVVGIDHLGTLLDMAAATAPRNCRFLARDYAALTAEDGPFDVLVCTLGIDFDQQEVMADRRNLYREDPTDVPPVARLRAALEPALAGWRRAAKAGAVASAVLRIPNVETLYAVAAAANTAGWLVEPSLASRINAGREGWLTRLVLRAAGGEGASTDFDALLAAYCLVGDRAVVPDGAALLDFRRLIGPKPVKSCETTFGDGHVGIREVGRHAEGGYIYDWTTTFWRRLTLVPASEFDPEGTDMTIRFGSR